MLIDLHNHTHRYSACSKLDPDMLCRLALRMELDGIVITEHDVYPEEAFIHSLRCRWPQLLILVGAEMTIPGHHVLVYGDQLSEGPYDSLEDLLASSRGNDTALVLAHPLRWDALDLLGDREAQRRFLANFHALEVASANLDREEQERGYRLFREWGFPLLAGSDAHDRHMCARYATRFPKTRNVPGSIDNEQDLAAAIRSGQFEPLKIR